MRAAIYKSTGSWYYAKTQDGKFWNARIKGAFRIEGLTSTNPLAVGDEVELAVENKDDGTAMITDIHKRKNYINRLSPANRHQHHIIASNVDQSLLIATLRDPKTSQGFIDRFLVAGESFHVPSVIIFNKADLYRKKETDLFEERKSMYESVGYRVIGMSLEKEGVPDALRALLGGKTTLVSGHSGVGKSTFINAVLPESGGGRIIDTPGIREFGLVDISKQELSHYFPEMRTRLGDCQFNNCLHLDEPNCAIKKALEEGRIYVDRYISYCNLLDSIEVNTY
jgi:ribosome biogenesis GTPase / thiamine phosphate phosphatase